MDDAACADALSQAIVCARPLIQVQREALTPAAAWLLRQSSDWERYVLQQVLADSPSAAAMEGLPMDHLYEFFLQEYSRAHRKRGGVFYTPPELVRLIVRNTDRLLREEFGLQDGLADTTTWGQMQQRHPNLAIPEGTMAEFPFVTILDPAVGTGAFLLEALEVIHQTVKTRRVHHWNQYVWAHLLPRLQGIEILPAPCLLAKLNIAVRLAQTGFEFGIDTDSRMNIRLGDTLTEPPAGRPTIPATVLLGNPPFSSLSENRGKWITELVRGTRAVPGYVNCGTQQLGERKTWLHDDYVKFFRYVQWLSEQVGCGIVGLVTNHGYLDNVTFRLMRQELLRVFPRIAIVDLHGNRKKGETTPDGGKDENVFGLDQGVAVGWFRRLSGTVPAGLVQHAELWGTIQHKLASLAGFGAELPPMEPLSPQPPHNLLVPRRESFHPEYERAWRLPEIMPVNTTAPVTARDGFVIATTREELVARLEEFRNLTIPDDVIRSRYFNKSRSAKYPPGDTRSWKLSLARQFLAAEENWQKHICRCLYRPFDWRFIFWHPAMIDWPRTEVTRHLLPSGGSDPLKESKECRLAFIVRRQQLPTQPCSFFWVTSTLAIDGVIRSDNRGSESLFPLYLDEQDTSGKTYRRANLIQKFVAQVAQQIKLKWVAEGAGDLLATFGPDDLLHYIYALFHAPTYRTRHAAELRGDFPRVLLPRDPAMFAEMVPRGRRLVDLHLMRTQPEAAATLDPSELSRFRAGGYVILRKSSLEHGQRVEEHPLALYIAATLAEQSAIEALIARHGGWPAAFAATP